MHLTITLLDTPPIGGWRGRSGIFHGAVQALSTSKYRVHVVDVGITSDQSVYPPVHTGLARAVSARPMIDSHRVALELAIENPDIIIAPLRGGVAQACLMARACGEAFTRTRIAIVVNESTRCRFLASDATSSDLSPVIADAMERQSLALADAVIFPGAEADPARLLDLSDRQPVVISRPIAKATVPALTHEVREIVFLGALQRSSGAGEFIEAIEQLWHKGILGDRIVTFLGPAADFAYGLSKEWLGMKARDWTFDFRLVPEIDHAQALLYAAGDGRLVVGVSSDDHELNVIRNCNRQHVACLGRPMTDPQLAKQLAIAIEAALQGVPRSNGKYWDIDWLSVVADIESLPSPPCPAALPTISVCILHYDRLSLLRQAIASIPAWVGNIEPEILVIDNASPIERIEDKIRELAIDRPKLRVLALSEALSPTAAYNCGLAAARGEIVVFLDDDNLLLPNGLQKLATALQSTNHDIVVSALDMFEDDGEGSGASIGHMIFLGSAYSAGLFFNAFGDTSMAVRREAFAAHGGFHDLGYLYPRFDWVSLAKAQSSGLRIGALQSPAVRYRHSVIRTALQPAKLDEASARALVFQAYRGSFDADLVARLAQLLHFSDI